MRTVSIHWKICCEKGQQDFLTHTDTEFSVLLITFMDLCSHPLERLIVLFYPKLKDQNTELIKYIHTSSAKSISVFK